MLLDQGDATDGDAVQARDQHLPASVHNRLRVVEGDEVGGFDRKEGFDPLQVQILEGTGVLGRCHGCDHDRIEFRGAGFRLLSHRKSMSEVEP